MAERSKFQFRMRDLLWALGLMGVEVALMVGSAIRGGWPLAVMFLCASLGTFVGCLHRQPIRGTFIGLGFCGLIGSVLVLALALAIPLLESFVNLFSR